MPEIFGININWANSKTSKQVIADDKNTKSFVEKTQEDGAIVLDDGINNSFLFSFDEKFTTEKDLIEKYRYMALDVDIDWAIDDIVNELFTFDSENKVVDIDLTQTKLTESIKTKITEEFDTVINLLDFNNIGDDIFRKWFIDGRLFIHKLVNQNKLDEGIKQLRFVDPISIKKVAEQNFVEEDGIRIYKEPTIYYVYKKQDDAKIGDTVHTSIIKVPEQAITYVHSGIKDPKTNSILSYLHRAIKPHNMLNKLEDATIIYKLARAPSRRVFYVDVGNLPKTSAEQYMRSIMNNFKNKMVYDSSTGELKEQTNHMSMLEDIWLPRREGSRGTEVSTLDGVNGFSDMDEVLYFRDKLFRSMQIPPSRIEQGAQFNLGRSSEITRDEVKFNKYIGKLRKKFSEMFRDLLKTQLLMKKVITEDDWLEFKQQINFEFNSDSFFYELKEAEILTARLEQLAEVEQYVGKYFSIEQVHTDILKRSEEETKKTEEQINKEIKEGKHDDGEEDDGGGFGGESKSSESEPETKPEVETEPSGDENEE